MELSATSSSVNLPDARSVPGGAGRSQQPIVVPSGTMDLQVSANHSEETLARQCSRIPDRQRRFIKTVEATADVAAIVEVVVPVRSIKVDEEIALRTTWRPNVSCWYDLKQPFAMNPSDVVGKAAIRPLPPKTRFG